ncbi:MAG: hypothetical protein OSJ64_01035 [Firmicutes bacterium]|nr:hypothetical protein [Bacillota bacterium]
MPLYIGVNGVVKEVKELTIAGGGVLKKGRNGYVGVNGVIKPFFTHKAADIDHVEFRPDYIAVTEQVDKTTESSYHQTVKTFGSSSVGSGLTLGCALEFQRWINSSDYAKTKLYIGTNTPLGKNPDYSNAAAGAYAGSSRIDAFGAHLTNCLTGNVNKGGYGFIMLWTCYIVDIKGQYIPIKDFIDSSDITTLSWPVKAMESGSYYTYFSSSTSFLGASGINIASTGFGNASYRAVFKTLSKDDITNSQCRLEQGVLTTSENNSQYGDLNIHYSGSNVGDNANLLINGKVIPIQSRLY